MSASIMQVFHQEMATYYMRPSFEYQEPASECVGLMIDVCLNPVLIYSFTHVDSEDACLEEGDGFDRQEAS